MRAVVQPVYGLPDVLRLAEVDQPAVPEDGVLVKVIATSLNKADWHMLTGTPYVIRAAGFGLFAPARPIIGKAIAAARARRGWQGPAGDRPAIRPRRAARGDALPRRRPYLRQERGHRPTRGGRPVTTEDRTPLTRERVLRAAISLADEQGLASLTMRTLGAALGVQAMSLYNHVANKDDLLDSIVDLVVGEIEVPSASVPWRVAMHARARSAHAVLLRHPWACALLMSRANVGPRMLRYVDATIGCLHRAGFPLAVVDHAWNAMDSYIYGFTLQKLNFPFEADDYAKIAASYLPSLASGRYPSLKVLTEAVAAGEHDGLHDLDFGLELLLDGLERVLGERSR